MKARIIFVIFVIALLAISGCDSREQREHRLRDRTGNYLVVAATTFQVKDEVSSHKSTYSYFRHPEDPNVLCTFHASQRNIVSCTLSVPKIPLSNHPNPPADTIGYGYY